MSVHMGVVVARVMAGDVEANPWRVLDWPAVPGHFGSPGSFRWPVPGTVSSISCADASTPFHVTKRGFRLFEKPFPEGADRYLVRVSLPVHDIGLCPGRQTKTEGLHEQSRFEVGSDEQGSRQHDSLSFDGGPQRMAMDCEAQSTPRIDSIDARRLQPFSQVGQKPFSGAQSRWISV